MSSLVKALRLTLPIMSICLRGEVLRTFFLIISLPLTLSSIYIVGSSAITSEINFIASNIYRGQLSSSCVLTRVVYQELQGVGMVPAYLVENVNKFLNFYGCRVTYVREDVDGVLVSVDLRENLPNVIQIVTPQGIRNVSVVGFVDCTYHSGGFIVLNSSEGYEMTKLCSRPSTQLTIINNFSGSFSKIMFLLALLSLIPFAVVSPLTFSRAIDSISKDVCVIKAQGLGLKELKHSLLLSLIALILISTTYGISVGVVLAHGALWALRFFGISIFSRPLPLPPLLLLASAYIVITSLSATLVVYSKVRMFENVC